MPALHPGEGARDFAAEEVHLVPLRQDLLLHEGGAEAVIADRCLEKGGMRAEVVVELPYSGMMQWIWVKGIVNLVGLAN